MILLLGLAILTIFSFYIYFLSRSVYLGWGSLLLVQLYEYSFGISQLNAGGIHLDVVDVVSFGLLAAGVIRTIPRLRERNTARMISLAYMALLTFSLIRGAITNTFISAANEARGFVPILAAMLYFLTAPVDAASVRRYVRLYFYYGIAFVVVALLAYAGLHIGGAAWLHSTESAINTIEDRLLPAVSALGLGVCFLYSLAWEEDGRFRQIYRWLPAIFLGTTLFLRHRSVYNVLLFGVAALLLTDNRLIRRLIPMAVLSLIVVVAFASVASTTAAPEDNPTGSTDASIEQDVTSGGSFLWRVDVWTALLFGQDQTPLTMLVGKGLGEGYITLNPSAGHWLNAPPHSEYITEYTRVGILGVILVVAFILRPLVKLWRLSTIDKSAIEPSPSTWIAVLVGALVYGVTYSLPADTYALIGIACAAVARQEERSAGLLPGMVPAANPSRRNRLASI